MSINNPDLLKELAGIAEEEAEQGRDLNDRSGGGDYEPPAAGPTRVRLVSYVELGVHTTGQVGSQYGQKTKPRARFVFELSGPLHPPREFDGKKVPHTIAFEEIIGLNAKNGYAKLFDLMAKSYPGTKNFFQLVGKAWRATVVHRKYKIGDQERTAAELKSKESGYTFSDVTYNDPETGELKKLKVDAPLTPISFFNWDRPSLTQWDSLYIGGEYDDGGSKNKVQNKIKVAENFVGSMIFSALVEAGREAETVAPPKPDKKAKAEAADPLAAEGGDDEGSDDAPAAAVEAPAAAPKAAGKGKAPPKPAKAPVAPPAEPEPAADAADEDDGDPLAGL